MYKDHLEKQLDAICWGLIVVLFVCMALIIYSFFQSVKIVKYENGIARDELIEFNDARYKCEKVEVKEVVWKKVETNE